jgi:hypothetical protein
MIPINAHINQHILWHKIYKTCSNEIAFIILENLFRHEIKTKLSCRFDLYLWNHNSFVAHASTPCKTSVPWSINIHVENVQALLIWYMHLWPKRFKCSKDLPNVEITSIHQIHKPPLPTYQVFAMEVLWTKQKLHLWTFWNTELGNIRCASF